MIASIRYASQNSHQAARAFDRPKRPSRYPASLPACAVARLREQLTIEWIYNSNAIEGSTLTLRETELILQHGITIGGKSLREHFEVINHRDAITYVESLVAQRGPFTPFQVRQIHSLVLARIDDANAGKYRNTNVRIGGSAHTPPEAWLDAEARHLQIIDRAAIAHDRLGQYAHLWMGTGEPRVPL